MEASDTAVLTEKSKRLTDQSEIDQDSLGNVLWYELQRSRKLWA